MWFPLQLRWELKKKLKHANTIIFEELTHFKLTSPYLRCVKSRLFKSWQNPPMQILIKYIHLICDHLWNMTRPFSPMCRVSVMGKCICEDTCRTHIWDMSYDVSCVDDFIFVRHSLGRTPRCTELGWLVMILLNGLSWVWHLWIDW